MFDQLYDRSIRPVESYLDWDGSTVKTPHFDPTDVPIRAEQFPWELAQLIELYIRRRPWRILELGVRDGGTLYHWIKYAPSGSHIVAVDPLEIGHDSVDTWYGWAKRVNIKLTVIKGLSHEKLGEVQRVFPSGIDFAFIDADHNYGGVRRDFELYGPMLKHGVMAFHDIVHQESGVPQFWEEVRNAGFVAQELVGNRVDTEVSGGGIGVVYL